MAKPLDALLMRGRLGFSSRRARRAAVDAILLTQQLGWYNDLMRLRTRILTLARHDEAREIKFELDALRSLTVAQRFRLMQQKTRELLQLLAQSGHRRPSGIFKRV